MQNSIESSCARGDTICLRPCKLTISSQLFARWHLFRHVGYLRHHQQVDLWPFDLESGVRVTCDVGYLCTNFSLPRPLCSRVRPDVRDRQTDRQRATQCARLAVLSISLRWNAFLAQRIIIDGRAWCQQCIGLVSASTPVDQHCMLWPCRELNYSSSSVVRPLSVFFVAVACCRGLWLIQQLSVHRGRPLLQIIKKHSSEKLSCQRRGKKTQFLSSRSTCTQQTIMSNGYFVNDAMRPENSVIRVLLPGYLHNLLNDLPYWMTLMCSYALLCPAPNRRGH